MAVARAVSNSGHGGSVLITTSTLHVLNTRMAAGWAVSGMPSLATQTTESKSLAPSGCAQQHW